MSARCFRIALLTLLVFAPFRSLAAAAEAPLSAPPKPVFDVAAYGAKGDGTTNDQAALQRAIDACGGTHGSVYLHDGRFLTGQITLRSDLTLFIAPSATLLGVRSTDEKDYPVKEAATDSHINSTCQRRLIWGENLHNVVITGGGAIDGQGDFAPWRSGKAASEKIVEKVRPSILEFSRSENIEVSHVALLRSAMWTQVYLECRGVVLRGLKVDTENISGTRDGMDICDCHDVMIEDCAIRSQDDGICFKGGNNTGSAHIVVRNCTIEKMNLSAGNGVKFGTASQGSFRDVLIENVTISNCGNSAFSWESVDGAVIESVTVRNCRVTHAAQVISLILGQRRNPAGKPVRPAGTMAHITFENLTADNGARPIACLVSGAPGCMIQDVRFIGLNLQFPGGVAAMPETPAEYRGDYPEGTRFGDLPAYAFYVRHADGVTFSGCHFSTAKPDARPPLVTEDVANLKRDF